jgi:hypothetical protein
MVSTGMPNITMSKTAIATADYISTATSTLNNSKSFLEPVPVNSSLDPATSENINPCTTLNPTLDPTSIRLDSLTLDPTSRLDCSTLDPTSISCFHKDIEVLKTVNKDPEENFSHQNSGKQFETGSGHPEEDFSHLSAEEQAVLRNISKIIKGRL